MTEIKRFQVCRDCFLALSRRRGLAVAPNHRTLTIQSLPLWRSQSFASRPEHHIKDRQRSLYHRREVTTTTKGLKANTGGKSERQDLNALHGRVLELSGSILKPTDAPVPAEQRILYVLEQFDAIAKSLADAHSIANAATLTYGGSATSALLGSVNTRKPPATVNKATLLNLITHKAEEIIRHPNVFITSSVLRTYVQLQVLLQQPYTLPDVFQLYANKPTPTAASNGRVKYTSAAPNAFNSAIDKETANAALAAAITAHDLSLTMAVIQTSFAAPAYARAKVLRQGAVPGAALAAAPIVAYGLSAQFSAWQTMLDPAQATAMAFAGFMTYVAAVGSMGYVAITTSNDQMDRVTWAQGIPLWERWVREEERAALDRVASAWGFKDQQRRGDEEGEEWDILRETCGMKGMVLDKVELMEGME